MKPLKVFGAHIPIKLRKDLMESEGALGIFDRVECRIEVDARLKGDALKQTLVHELVHAIFARAGLAQTDISSDVEEIICEQVAIVINENFRLTQK